MYPTWLINSFTDNPCTQCRAPITVDDITGIGLARPSDLETYLREPLALILATCRHCGQKHNFRMRCLKDSLIDAMNELADQIAAAPPGDPLPFGPGSAASARCETGSGSGEANKLPVRPSLRSNQKMTPPSQEEIRVFLARLKRMSFRRGSRDFNKFTDDSQNHGNTNPNSGAE